MRWPAGFTTRWRRFLIAIKPRPKTLGQRGEAAAARYLKRLGYTIIERGTHVHRGEIDIIAVDGRTVVFVEVKTRVSHSAGHPADAVDQHKQQRLSRMALVYLKRHGLMNTSARFDVVAVTWPKDQRRPKIEHFRNAFEASGGERMFG